MMFKKFTGKARYFFALGCLALPLNIYSQSYYRCDSTVATFSASVYGNGWVRCNGMDLVEVEEPTTNINDITTALNELTTFDVETFTWLIGFALSVFIIAFGLGISSRFLTRT